MGDSLCALDGGSLAEAPLAAVLIEALRARATGELRLDARGGASKIYLRGGQPCGAQVFFAFKSLGQFLLEQGWIDMEALDRSLAKVAEGQKQGQALLELGVIDEARLKLGLALHHQAHIRNLASTTEGTYSFNAQAKLPAWTEEIRISAHRCIFDALTEAPGRAIARKILGRIGPGEGLKLRDGWEKYAAHFQLDAAELELAALLAVSRAPAALLASGLAAAERTEPLCAAFLLMGLGQPAPLDPSPMPSAAPAPAAAGGRTEGVGAALFSVVASPAAPPPAVAARPSLSAEERARKMRESQERELAAMEAQKQAEAQEEARMRASWAAEEQVRRAEALKAPKVEFRSDEAAAKERRLRMLKRAFGQIPGGLRMDRPEAATPAPVEAPTPAAPPSPAAIASLSADDRKLAKTIEERAAKVKGENFFERLTVTSKSTRDQIKQAYFAAAKSYHPDKIPPGLQHLAPKMKEIFAAVTEAWEVLQDDEQRRKYERELKALEASGGLTRAQRDELELQIVRGEMALKKRAWSEARRAFEAAVRLHARPDLEATLLWCRYNDPDVKLPMSETRKALSAIASANPNTAGPHYFLGVLARVDGDGDRAESHFQAAVKANPKHAESNQELRLLQLRKGKG